VFTVSRSLALALLCLVLGACGGSFIGGDSGDIGVVVTFRTGLDPGDDHIERYRSRSIVDASSREIFGDKERVRYRLALGEDAAASDLADLLLDLAEDPDVECARVVEVDERDEERFASC
jgi:hypothetical protein